MSSVPRFGIVFAANVAVFYALFPEYRDQIVEEDYLVENMSAAAFLLAAALAGRALYLGAGRRRGLLRLVLGLGIVGFLDELSFGERLFDLDVPRIAGTNLDAVHDVVEIAFNLAGLEETPVFVLLLGAAILLLAAGLFFAAFLARAVERIRRDSALAMLAVVGALLAAAILLDLPPFESPLSEFFEEIFELNAGLALVGVVLAARETQLERGR